MDFANYTGKTGSHAELAKLLESAGFLVVMDSDDNERSIVKVIQGDDESEVGEIVGDSEAVIR